MASFSAWSWIFTNSAPISWQSSSSVWTSPFLSVILNTFIFWNGYVLWLHEICCNPILCHWPFCLDRSWVDVNTIVAIRHRHKISDCSLYSFCKLNEKVVATKWLHEYNCIEPVILQMYAASSDGSILSQQFPLGVIANGGDDLSAPAHHSLKKILITLKLFV